MLSSAATAGCGSASALTAPCLRVRAIIASLVTSLYRTKMQVGPLPSSLIFWPQQAVITSFTQAIEASRSHATTISSKRFFRSIGAPALAGSYLVDMLRGATNFSVDENLDENSLQQIPLAGMAELEPGDLLGTSPCPLLRVSVASLLYDAVSYTHLTLPTIYSV